MDTARKALQLARFVAGLVNAEYKSYDQDILVNVDVGGSWSVTNESLCDMGVGDESNQRNGNSIRAKSISIKYDVRAQSNATAFRFILFIDNASNGASPVGTDLLDIANTSVPVLTRYNPDYAGQRFVILKDMTITVDPQGIQRVINSIFIKLSHHVKYNKDTATAADYATGHLFMAYVSTDSAENGPIVNMNSRFSYIDN
jgi:hypothetical protein